MRKTTSCFKAQRCKGCARISQIGLTNEHTVRHIDKTLPVSNERRLIRDREHDDPWSRIMPGTSVIRMLKCKGEASVKNLCGLQARREIRTCNDVQLEGGRWDLGRCHGEILNPI